MSIPSAEYYLKALQDGDRKVVQELYETIFPKIRRYIVSNRGDEQDALDVFHDALMYMMTQGDNLKKIRAFEPYVFIVCKNLWLKQLKNRVIKKEVTTLKEHSTDLSMFVLEQECYDFYIEKFGLLSENCKEILSLYFNGLSYEEIVKEKAYASINTVRQRVFKCRSKLVDLIKKDKKFESILKRKCS